MIDQDLIERFHGVMGSQRASGGPDPVPVVRPFVRLVDVEERSVAWLWPGRLAWDHVAVLAGDGAVGKSTVVMDIAARVSRGEAMPGGEPRTGSVVILTAEEDAGVVIRPRMRLMGADLDRVVVMDPDAADVTFPSGVERVAAVCETEEVRLVVIDTGPAFLDPGLKSNAEEDIRRMLRPLAALAAARGMSVVVLAHLNKGAGQGAGHRIMGGAAWRNAARQVLLVAAPPHQSPRDTSERVIAVEKNNLGIYPPAVAFSLVAAVDDPSRAVVEWGAELPGVGADDLVAVATGEERGAVADAWQWLEDALSGGPLAARDLRQLADAAGIAWRAVERAKKAHAASVTVKRTVTGWVWELKAAIDTANQKPGGVGGLGGLTLVASDD